MASKLACAGVRSAPQKRESAAQTAGASSLATANPLEHFFIFLNIWDLNLYIEIFQAMGL